MAYSVTLKHPTLDVQIVVSDGDKAKEWQDQGWVRVKRDEEPDYPNAQPVPNPPSD